LRLSFARTDAQGVPYIAVCVAVSFLGHGEHVQSYPSSLFSWINAKMPHRSRTANTTGKSPASFAALHGNAGFPKVRQELLDLAGRYERRADHFERRAAPLGSRIDRSQPPVTD
jgi:hypothetical protein